MIVRAWRGYASRSNPAGYPEHFRRNVVPELAGIGGFLGAELLRADGSDRLEFLVLTRWASMEAIRAFAGDTVDRAMVEPEAVRALTGFDETVRHFEVLEEVPAASAGE